ncbi:hypothetical protein GCM10023322_31880 [Rugosimonospora acidiphila]|uniref:Uncharacterized protein n=1 Tax=Rugosimonospora acidiphila TaxID=556531 RepID=A0ABP9RTG4_9ACTN
MLDAPGKAAALAAPDRTGDTTAPRTTSPTTRPIRITSLDGGQWKRGTMGSLTGDARDSTKVAGPAERENLASIPAPAMLSQDQ